jgi:hypothetical protein
VELQPGEDEGDRFEGVLIDRSCQPLQALLERRLIYVDACQVIKLQSPVRQHFLYSKYHFSIKIGSVDEK